MSGTLKYRVVARRVTIYEVEAANAEEAEQTFTDKDEVDGNTQEIWAVALCPECTEPLTNRTRREYEYEGEEYEENSYCDTCDREISAEEEE